MALQPSSLLCPNCSVPVAPESWNAASPAPCHWCRTPIQVLAFPEFFAPPPIVAAPDVIPGDASCFFHPGKSAVLPCDNCGRFLCRLCDIPWGDRHYCTACVASGQTRKGPQAFDSSRSNNDTIALSIAIAGLFGMPFSLFLSPVLAAPVTFYMTLKHWNQPPGPIPRSKIRFLLASVIALLQLGLLIWLGVYFYETLSRIRNTPGVTR